MTKAKIHTIDITNQVGDMLEKAGFGSDSNDEKDITKASVWNLMDALTGTDNTKFTIDDAREELKKRGL